ncbi:cytochrome P450 [Amylostereum chailletii]|nr:cytochrome P450 [Amylostereum chailletii]
MTVFIVCASSTLFYIVRRWNSQRHLRLVPGIPSPSFMMGNLAQMFNQESFSFRDQLNRLPGKVVRVSGALGESLLMIKDTKAINSILVKDQHAFEEIDAFLELNRLCLGPGLLSTHGATHKRQRKLLNPAFSTNHMRRLVPMFQSITKELQSIFRKELADGPKELEVLEWMGRLALELIAQAGMGYTFNALQGENNDYALALKTYLPTWSSIQLESRWLPTLLSIFPQRFLRVLADNVPWPAVQSLAKMSDTLYDVPKEIWENKKALAAQGADGIVNQLGEGKDVMSILLNSNSAADEHDRLPDDELLAQMTTLLFAGTDTTSSALARILHMLCLHPDVQDKLREELTAAGSATGELDHDALNELPYLDAVCRETLRVFPPVSLAQRVAQQDAILPLTTPLTGTDGRPLPALIIPKSATVIVNILGVNHDTDIWGADAREWKPERWLAPLPESVARARVPGVYANQLTFIGGGRACIGFKFSELEMKVVLAQLLPVFRFALPANKEIVWRFGAIVTPAVAGAAASEKPHMPLVVSLI